MDLGQVLLTVLLILGLIYIFFKSDRTEGLLFLKLLGYYALGSFRFNLNRIAIPLGFIIYLFAMHPKQNLKSKRQAAALGLAFFVIGLAGPALGNYIYRLPVEVETRSENIYRFNFENDWLVLQQRFELPDNTRLEDFDAEFESDGSIREMRCELITMESQGMVHYYVNFKREKRAYSIRRSKLDQWVQYNRLVTAPRFFHVMSGLDIEEIKPEQEYEWYCISSHGEFISYGIKDREKFLIDDSNGDIQRIGDEQLPVKGYYISFYGMAKADETSYESRGVRDFLFDVAGE